MKKTIFILIALLSLVSCATSRRPLPGGYTQDELQKVKESKILALENITLNGENEIKIQVGDDDNFILANRKCAIFIFLNGAPDNFEDCTIKAEDLEGRDDIGVIHLKTDKDGWIFVKNVPGDPCFILGIEKK